MKEEEDEEEDMEGMVTIALHAMAIRWQPSFEYVGGAYAGCSKAMLRSRLSHRLLHDNSLLHKMGLGFGNPDWSSKGFRVLGFKSLEFTMGR